MRRAERLLRRVDALRARRVSRASDLAAALKVSARPRSFGPQGAAVMAETVFPAT